MSEPITKIKGDLIITSANAQEYAALTTICGDLYVKADTQLPALTTVGGYLIINADTQLPALTSVGEYLEIDADTQLPALTTIGRYLIISADTQLPALTTVGGELIIRAEAQLPALTSVGGYALPDKSQAHQALVKVAQHILAHPENLRMDDWHCDTAHCVGGWAVKLGGAKARRIEKDAGTSIAATHLLGLEGARLFHRPQDEALTDLAELAEREKHSSLGPQYKSLKG